MKCKQVQDMLLTDYRDGRLDAKKRTTIEEHLKACAVCERFAHQELFPRLDMCREAGAIKPPDRVWNRIEESIDRAEKQSWRVFAENVRSFFAGILQNIPKPAVAFALVLLVSAGGFYLFQNPGAGTPAGQNYLGEQIMYLAGFESENALSETDEFLGTSIELFFM